MNEDDENTIVTGAFEDEEDLEIWRYFGHSSMIVMRKTLVCWHYCLAAARGNVAIVSG